MEKGKAVVGGQLTEIQSTCGGGGGGSSGRYLDNLLIANFLKSTELMTFKVF